MSITLRIVTWVISFAALSAAEAGELEYVRDIENFSVDQQIVIDTRPAARCTENSLAGARCLPATDFIGPHSRLAAFVDIGWLLGSAGLTGNESLLVVGDKAVNRDFVAGVLHVMGQRRVRVLSQSVSRIIGSKSLPLGTGSARAATRERVYSAAARSGTVIFSKELAQRLGAKQPVILDGRSEAEYWGKAVRAQRGGHLPGADHLSAAALRGALARGERPGPSPAQGKPIVYGHAAIESFAFYTLVRAGLGLDAAVYPGGWADWAASAHPADAATHPDRLAISPPSAMSAKSIETWIPGFIGTAMLALAMLALGVVLGRRRAA